MVMVTEMSGRGPMLQILQLTGVFGYVPPPPPPPNATMLSCSLEGCVCKVLDLYTSACPLYAGPSDLPIVLCRLHLQDVRDYTVDGDVADQASKKEFLGNARVHKS